MGALLDNAKELTAEYEAQNLALQQAEEITGRIVGLQGQGIQQVLELPEESDPLRVGRSEGGVGGTGGFERFGESGVIGLLLGAIQILGTGNQAGPPGFEPGPPILTGATFARSLALSQDGGAFQRLSSGFG